MPNRPCVNCASETFGIIGETPVYHCRKAPCNCTCHLTIGEKERSITRRPTNQILALTASRDAYKARADDCAEDRKTLLDFVAKRAELGDEEAKAVLLLVCGDPLKF